MSRFDFDKPAWLSKLNWLGILTVAIGIIQLLADSDLTPADIDKVLLILIGALTIVLRTFFTDKPVTLVVLLLALAIGCPGAAMAEEVGVVVDDAKPGTYLVTVLPDRTVSVNPFRVIRPGANPSPPPNVPPPGPQSPAFATSKLLAEQALAKPGATKQTGAGLSAVYSAVSREINTGGLDPKLATAAIAMGVNEVYKKASPADKAAWSVYSTSIARALSEASVAGDLAATGKWVVTLDDFHKGIDAATGIPVEITTLSTTNPDTAGVLDGIDLRKLIDLILEIIKLINTLKGI